LIKQFGLPETSHKYYLIYIESINVKECPIDKDHVRAKLFMLFLIEEMPERPGFLKGTEVSRIAPGGSIPNFAVNSMATKQPIEFVSKCLQKYYELEKKGVL
jgi:hypothetical protein